MEPKDRPTPAELGDKAIGLECQYCGCHDFRVVQTRPRPGFIRRERVCRHCGKKKYTKEK